MSAKLNPTTKLDTETARTLLAVMESAEILGPFLQQACAEGKLGLLRSLDELVGREQFRRWFEGEGRLVEDAFVAAAAGWHVEVFRFLLGVYGAVPHSISSVRPAGVALTELGSRYADSDAPWTGRPYCNPPAPAVGCRTLEVALGLRMVEKTSVSVGLQDLRRCTPNAEIVRLILEAHPTIHPGMLMDRSIRYREHEMGRIDHPDDRRDTILSWAILSGDRKLLSELLPRTPKFVMADFVHAAESGDVELLSNMIESLQVMPLQVFGAIGRMPADQQREVIARLKPIPFTEEPSLSNLSRGLLGPDDQGFVAEAYRAMCEVLGVNRQLVFLAAVKAGNRDAVLELAGLGADPNAGYASKSGQQKYAAPLFVAEDADMVHLLAKCGANPDAVDEQGLVPLQYWLSSYPYPDVVSKLVDKVFAIAECGADLGIKTPDGKTLAKLASRWPEQVRRALASAKMRAKLGSVMQGGEGVSLTSAKSGFSPL